MPELAPVKNTRFIVKLAAGAQMVPPFNSEHSHEYCSRGGLPGDPRSLARGMLEREQLQ
jgi:hypothetical protein